MVSDQHFFCCRNLGSALVTAGSPIFWHPHALYFWALVSAHTSGCSAGRGSVGGVIITGGNTVHQPIPWKADAVQQPTRFSHRAHSSTWIRPELGRVFLPWPKWLAIAPERRSRSIRAMTTTFCEETVVISRMTLPGRRPKSELASFFQAKKPMRLTPHGWIVRPFIYTWYDP